MGKTAGSHIVTEEVPCFQRNPAFSDDRVNKWKRKQPWLHPVTVNRPALKPLPEFLLQKIINTHYCVLLFELNLGLAFRKTNSK